MSDPFNPASVGQLADALPPRGANAAGTAARSALVHRIKRGTPGRYSSLFGTGPLFRDVFFPATGANGDDARIGALTGLDDGFFAGFAVLCLCAQIQSCTSRLRPQMVIGRITADLADRNRTLRGQASAWYASVLADTPGPVNTALRAFGDEPARREALAHYVEGLTSPTWINEKLSQDEMGNWPDRDWELYHHWVKLLALGAGTTLVDDTIRRIRDGGLGVPDALGPGAWRSWSRWWIEDIGGFDVTDAIGPILETTYLVVPGGPPSALPEGNSYEFTANGQPGNGYRQLPSSSCFAPGTQVVMADGSLRGIERIQPGDSVRTPRGPRTVLMCSTPLRAGRTLVRFAGTDFAFADTHPFLVARPEPPAGGDGTAGAAPAAVPAETDGGHACYAAADPVALARDVPTLAQFGIRPLGGEHPPLLWRFHPHGDLPHRAGPVVAAPDRRPERLHDLFLSVGEDGRSEFYAGDGHIQLLVSSEAPRFSAAPETTEVLLGILGACTGTILDTLDHVPDDAFADVLSVGLESVGRGMLAEIGADLLPRRPVRDAGVPGPTAGELAGAVSAFAASMGGTDPRIRQRVGTLVEQLVARFAGPFQAAIVLGWRRFPRYDQDNGCLLAVTVHSIEMLNRPATVPARDAAVRVELCRAGARFAAVMPVQPAAGTDRYCYTVDAVTYFSQWRPILEPAVEAQHESAWALRVRLVGADQPDEGDPGTAVCVLPRLLRPKYDALSVPVVDPDGAVCGRAGLDVRALTAGDLVGEARARELWHPDLRHVVARRLTELASAYINERFPAAIEVFGSRAATVDARPGRTRRG